MVPSCVDPTNGTPLAFRPSPNERPMSWRNRVSHKTRSTSKGGSGGRSRRVLGSCIYFDRSKVRSFRGYRPSGHGAVFLTVIEMPQTCHPDQCSIPSPVAETTERVTSVFITSFTSTQKTEPLPKHPTPLPVQSTSHRNRRVQGQLSTRFKGTRSKSGVPSLIPSVGASHRKD